MQQVVSRPDNNKPTNIQKVVITAITLFAVAGFVLGFGVGAFARPPARVQQGITPPSHGATVVTGPTPTATATQGPQQVTLLGCPLVPSFTEAEKADSTTTYTLSAQAYDRSGKCDIANNTNKPLRVAGITFKLWLIQRLPDNQLIVFNGAEGAKLQHPETLVSPITGTLKGTNTDYPDVQGLQFDPTTPQVQPSNAQGLANWKYTIAPTIPAGDYNLLVLTDWNGKSSNWSWRNITVKSTAGN